MIILKCKNLSFLSELDELTFFERIGKIKCIKSCEGINSTILLNVNEKKISDQCLRELLSLFFRYKVKMKQLSQFETKKNRKWFVNDQAYWFKKTFK